MEVGEALGDLYGKKVSFKNFPTEPESDSRYRSPLEFAFGESVDDVPNDTCAASCIGSMTAFGCILPGAASGGAYSTSLEEDVPFVFDDPNGEYDFFSDDPIRESASRYDETFVFSLSSWGGVPCVARESCA